MADELATIDDVVARRGALTTAEETAATYLLHAASIIIAKAGGKTLASLADLDDDTKDFLGIICVDVVLRVMANPDDAAVIREALGAYSVSRTFKNDDTDGGGLLLTKKEELLARRAIFGTTTGSSRVGSILEDVTCSDALGA